MKFGCGVLSVEASVFALKRGDISVISLLILPTCSVSERFSSSARLRHEQRVKVLRNMSRSFEERPA